MFPKGKYFSFIIARLGNETHKHVGRHSKIIKNTYTNVLIHFSREPFYTKSIGEDVTVWNKIALSSPKFLHIGQQSVEMINDPFVESLAFWKSLSFQDE